MDDLHLPESLILDLVLRRLLLEGFASLQSLSKNLRLSLPVVDRAFRHLRSQQLLEVKGMLGNDYQFILSRAGKDLATERFQISQYAGAAPVSLTDYHSATRAQSADVHVDRKALRSALSDLVVTDRLPGSTGSGADFAELDLRLWSLRQREDEYRRAHVACVSGRGADSVRDRSRQPDHQSL